MKSIRAGLIKILVICCLSAMLVSICLGEEPSKDISCLSLIKINCLNHKPKHSVPIGEIEAYKKKEGCEFSTTTNAFAKAFGKAEEGSKDYCFDKEAGGIPRSNWLVGEIYQGAGFKNYPAYTTGYPILPKHLVTYSDDLGFKKVSEETAVPGDIVAWDKHMGIYAGKNGKNEDMVIHASSKKNGVVSVSSIKYVSEDLGTSPNYLSVAASDEGIEKTIKTDESSFIINTKGFDTGILNTAPAYGIQNK